MSIIKEIKSDAHIFLAVLFFVVSSLLPLNIASEWHGFLFQSIFIFLVLLYYQSKKISIISLFLVFFFSIWTVFSAIFISYRFSYVDVFKNIFLIFSLIILIKEYNFKNIKKSISFHSLCKIIYTLGGLVVLGFVLRYFFPVIMQKIYPGKSYITDSISRNSSFFVNPNYAGFSLCVFFLLILLIPKYRIFKICSIVLIFSCILLTGSRSSFVCFFWIAILNSIIFKKSIIALTGSALLLITSLKYDIGSLLLFKRTLNMDNLSEIGGRDQIYKIGIEYIDNNLLSFIFGYGISPIDVSDSLFLNWILRFGVVGFVLFILTVVFLHSKSKSLLYFLCFFPMYFVVEVLNSPSLILLYFMGLIFYQALQFHNLKRIIID